MKRKNARAKKGLYLSKWDAKKAESLKMCT